MIDGFVSLKDELLKIEKIVKKLSNGEGSGVLTPAENLIISTSNLP
jgi:hypothetical protein